MDTSLIDIDINPTYVRGFIRGKVRITTMKLVLMDVSPCTLERNIARYNVAHTTTL